MYLPSAGFCLLMALLLGVSRTGGDGPQPYSRRLAVVALLVLVAGLAIATWARCLDWRNDETLFMAAMRAQPESPRAHFIVGKIHGDRGELEQALALLDRTIELYPEHVSALVEKGVLLGRTGDLEGASEQFREALAVNPANPTAHLDLGIALHRMGRFEGSEKALLKAVRWDPALSKGWAELGNLYLDMRLFSRAAGAYRRAIALGREDLVPRLRIAERGAASG
jgi:tetratricopeptide (TPR) repeat protein